MELSLPDSTQLIKTTIFSHQPVINGIKINSDPSQIYASKIFSETDLL